MHIGNFYNFFLFGQQHVHAIYVASTSTEQPIVNNGIDDSIQQVYFLEPIVKSEIDEQHKPIIKHQGQQRYKQIPKNIIKTPTVFSKLKYIPFIKFKEKNLFNIYHTHFFCIFSFCI